MNRRGAGIALIGIAAFLWVSGEFMSILANHSSQTLANAFSIVALIMGLIYLYLGEKDESTRH